jgi:hypothetical protein
MPSKIRQIKREEWKMNNRIAGLLVMALLVGGTVGTLRADQTQWQKNHPARTKDNKRVKRQVNAAKNQYKAGTITKAQEQADIKTDRGIKQEERADAQSNQNGGHLTAAQQQSLNQQLNAQHQQLNTQAQ